MQGKKLEITDIQYKNIKQLYSTGLCKAEVANQLGISEWAIRKVLKGKTRKHAEWSWFVAKKKEDILSHKQKQCILGTLLGDASLSSRRNSWEYQVSHCLAQKKYSEHIATVLNRQVREYTKCQNSFSPKSKYYKVNYANKAALAKIADIVLVNGKKTVSKNWAELIDNIGIAYWFMDDGSSSWHRNSVKVSLSALSFDVQELELLQHRLLHFDIKTYLAKHSLRKNTNKQQFTIEICTKSINQFMDLVQPHVLDCFAYKIKRIK